MGEINYFVRKQEEGIVFGFFSALPGVNHPVFDFQAGAVNLPPARFAFEQDGERILGLSLFEIAQQDDRAVGIAAIHLVHGLDCFGRELNFAGMPGSGGE